MGWSDPATEKQIGAIALMVSNCVRPSFTQDEKNAFLAMIKTRKDASEAMENIRQVRIIESSRSCEKKEGEWYQKLLDLSRERRTKERIDQLEKMIKEHPTSSCTGLWMRELNVLKEEK